MRITLIDVPYDCGRYGERMGGGPEQLVEALPERLAAAGHEVATAPVRLERRFEAEVGAVIALQAGVRREVAAARREGRLPIVLSGNCGVAALGATAALTDPWVVWLDAHADFNTPETSPSGFFDGMALRTLTGGCWHAVAERLAELTPVPEERVVLVGARELDAAERDALAASRVRWLTPAALREQPDALIEALAAIPAEAPLYLHLDLDVLDPEALRANEYAAAGGLTLAETAEVLRAAAGRGPLGALAVTAYDPEADPMDRGVEVVDQLLAALLPAVTVAPPDDGS